MEKKHKLDKPRIIEYITAASVAGLLGVIGTATYVNSCQNQRVPITMLYDCLAPGAKLTNFPAMPQTQYSTNQSSTNSPSVQDRDERTKRVINYVDELNAEPEIKEK